MKLSPRDQIIIAVVLIVLFAAGFFALVILPRFGEIADLDDELVGIDQDLLTAEALLARRQASKEEAAQTQVKLLDIASGLPESPELPSLIIELQDSANAVEIDFVQVSPGTPVPHASLELSVIPVQMTIEGTWEQFIDFMERLGSLRREVRVTDIAVTSVPPTEEAPSAAPDADGDSTMEVDPEDEIYTVLARISLEAYMMPAELSVVPEPAVPDTPE